MTEILSTVLTVGLPTFVTFTGIPMVSMVAIVTFRGVPE